MTERAAAQSTGIRGTITFEGGGRIPEGRLAIALDDPATRESGKQATQAQIASTGNAKELRFSLDLSDGTSLPPSTQIVVRLERADGWLLARGSTSLITGKPVEITLFTAMY